MDQPSPCRDRCEEALHDGGPHHAPQSSPPSRAPRAAGARATQPAPAAGAAGAARAASGLRGRYGRDPGGCPRPGASRASHRGALRAPEARAARACAAQGGTAAARAGVRRRAPGPRVRRAARPGGVRTPDRGGASGRARPRLGVRRGAVRPSAPAPGAYVTDVLAGRWRLPRDVVELVAQARRLAARFLPRSLTEIDWPRYAVLGLSAPVGQTVAALAVAKAVKEARPDVRIVVGGPAWHGVMGRRQLAVFPFVDAACTGDGDDAFPAYCAWVAAGCEGPPPAGLLLRRGVGRSPPLSRRSTTWTPCRFRTTRTSTALWTVGRRLTWRAARRRGLPRLLVGGKPPVRVLRAERAHPPLSAEVGRPHPLRTPGAGPALAAVAHRSRRQRGAAGVPSRGAAPARRVAAHGAFVLRGAP